MSRHLAILILLLAQLLVACSDATTSPTAVETISRAAAPSVVALESPTPTPGAERTPAPPAPPSPADLGITDPLPATTAAQLQAVLDVAAADTPAPATEAAVIIPGVGTWTGATGVIDVVAGVAATPAARFAIASVTKTYVASLVLLLASDGVLDLDATVATWLPELPNVDAAVTVRQLLNHTSGVADYLASPGLLATARDDPTHAWTPAELLAAAGAPDFAPGTSHRYSNSNYIVLGELLGTAAGQPFGTLLATRLLEPLRLDATYAQPDVVPAGALAHGYSTFGTGPRGDLDDGSGFVPNLTGATAAGTAGGIVATALDVARWGDALYGGRVLPAPALEEMLAFGEGDYGLGAELRRLGTHEVIGHNGRTLGFVSLLAHDPASGITVVALANGDGLAIDDLAAPLLEAALAIGG